MVAEVARLWVYGDTGALKTPSQSRLWQVCKAGLLALLRTRETERVPPIWACRHSDLSKLLIAALTCTHVYVSSRAYGPRFLPERNLTMPACPRSEIVLEGEIGYYHVWTRCVRQSYLCGRDARTGKNFEHRRDWIRDYLPRLCELFAVDANFHVEMQTHLHLVLRTCPDIVRTFSDEEVVRRWVTICRLIRSKDGRTIKEITDERIALEVAKPGRIERLRKNLSSVSQFMKGIVRTPGAPSQSRGRRQRLIF